MFKPESWQSTSEYRTLLDPALKKMSRYPSAFGTWHYRDVIDKMKNLSLDEAGEIVQELYSTTGRPAKNQAQILRSVILFTLLFNKTPAGTSLTLWVRDVLPMSSLFISLIGCSSSSELPPLGSYYDFMNRLWQGNREHYSRSYFYPRQKNGKKPKKEIGPDEKLVEEESYKTYDIVQRIMDGKPAINSNPESILQDIFYIIGVLPSVRLGLINISDLTVSGDGTAVVSHSYSYGHRASGSSSEDQYHYSDPDAGWGWDSSKKAWYFGRTLYLLACRNNKLGLDLPLTMRFTEARRHDSISFLYTIDDMGRHMPILSPTNMCLDSAHDNIPTYQLLEHWDINALIDINSRCRTSENAPKDISFDKKGHPLCRCGIEMKYWGNDKVRDACKYRCPLKCGKIDSCEHEQECSPGKYGRTIYIPNHGDLRFRPRIPRDSEKYTSIYKERTGCERLNQRFLNDYKLQHLKIRCTDHFSFWAMIIGICIHLDARCKAAHMFE